MERNIVVTEATGHFIEDMPVEIVERKGLGHPDSLCDGIAERVSLEYCRWCENEFGVLLHHNFDKVQLAAGEVDVHFGGGHVIRPIRIQIAGRGTPSYKGRMVPMDTIAIEAARSHLRETMRYLDPVKHVNIQCYAGRGDNALVSTVENVEANDTSFGVSHWPRSRLENAVYETANYINGPLRDQFPIGEDIKVMGCRHNGEVILTVAIPFIASRIKDAEEYLEIKGAVQAAIQAFSRELDSRKVTVEVNTADKAKRGDYYLTITGTSAECGDDGAVGRGNRVNGVIAPFRSASFEAACGKNPISHVGKVYNVLAFLVAQDIVNQVPGVKEATVYILSQIGKPLDQPLVAAALIRPQKALTAEIEGDVHDVMDHRLAHVTDISAIIRTGELRLY
ncbi:MAG: methionine adenosyltransferase [Anaerolineae bacterium]